MSAGLFSVQKLPETEIGRRLKTGLDQPWRVPDADSPYLISLLQGQPRPAAVLMPLLQIEDQWHLLYTRRTETLAEHSGQVAFPGGRMEPEDPNPVQGALREANEEIGLHPGDVRILGWMNSYLTVTNYRVTPVVGVIPWPYPLKIANHEVSRVFSIPLSWLADPANHENRMRILPRPHDPVPVVYFRPYDDEILWGASARFTLAFLEILLK